ncbi:uncharacterized protein LOC134658179 [Cydia amplana]|uniref:uncharacterized protein LOC134658179 n=1 Tax=Cydia amplana TaxID=1869771 RepID=UPI002FE624F0
MHSDYVKSKMNINRRLQTEYLLNNIIDKEFQSMMFPLGFVPFFFLMSRFKIINNFITPDNCVSSYIKSFIGSIILASSHFFRFYYYTEIFKGFTSDVVFFLFYFDLIFFSIISFTTYTVSSYQRNNVVELIIKLQHVLNFIKIDKVEFLSKQKNGNWYSVLMVFSVYVFHWLSASQRRFLDVLYQSSIMATLSLTWSMKNFFLIIVLTIACENFYRSVELAESSCAQLLSCSKSNEMRKTCKNVLRLNRASPRKMSAFGVFELDATFPLRLLSGLVTYCAVLLQFAFLSS